MNSQGTEDNLGGIVEKTRLLEELSKERGVSLGQAYVIARKDMLDPSLKGELHLLNGALSQLIWEQTRNWAGDPFNKPGIAHVLGIVGVAEDYQISLAEAAKIAIKENRNNEHWNAIAWAIQFLGQKAE